MDAGMRRAPPDHAFRLSAVPAAAALKDHTMTCRTLTRTGIGALLAAVVTTLAPVAAVGDSVRVTASGVNRATPHLSPVTEAMLTDPPAGSWLTHRGNREAWGYSALEQIDRSNVQRLTVAWAWGIDPTRPQTQPLVHDGIMFVNGSRDVIEALDAATGEHIWTYRRDLPEDLYPLAFGNRNIALYSEAIIVATGDAHLVALAAETGAVLWDHEVADHTLGFQYTGGPIVADGKIIAPMSGCYNFAPGGCFVTAHDPETGAEIWRRYVNAREDEAGGDSWGDTPVAERYGGSVWMPPTYDAEAGILYVGTAVPVPWGRAQRPSEGDLLHTNSTLALDVDTGEILWNVQHMPNDNFDYDYPFERHVVDATVAPDPAAVRWINPELEAGLRKIVIGPWGKPAIIHAHDRLTGAFLWARETVYQDVILDIDTTTGRPTYNAALIHQTDTDTRRICPSYTGGRNWPSVSYSPQTNVLYMPLNNTCMDLDLKPVRFEVGRYHGSGRGVPAHAPGSEYVGRLEAVDVTTGRTLFKHEQRAAIFGATLATAGGLVFYGDVAREFKALDDESGNVLWSIRLDSAIHGYPISYEVNGEQYIAISTGGAGLSFSTLTPEIAIPSHSATLWVFKLMDQ